MTVFILSRFYLYTQYNYINITTAFMILIFHVFFKKDFEKLKVHVLKIVWLNELKFFTNQKTVGKSKIDICKKMLLYYLSPHLIFVPNSILILFIPIFVFFFIHFSPEIIGRMWHFIYFAGKTKVNSSKTDRKNVYLPCERLFLLTTNLLISL